MTRRVDVAIVGAGSAGLSAVKEVRKVTQSFVVIDAGPLGTTCARVACMPSKVLIQIANDFHRRSALLRQGILGGEQLTIDTQAAWRRVRELRDGFVGGMLEVVHALEDHFIAGHARFVAPNELRIDEKETIGAERIVLATGSRPILPKEWLPCRDRILTSDEIFEIEEVPASIAVVGLGLVGLELGQALARLGVNITGFDRSGLLGGLSDPAVNRYAIEKLGGEFEMVLGTAAAVERQGDKLRVCAGDREILVDRVLASLGRQPNVDAMDIEKSGATLKDGKPQFNPHTMQIENLPLFIAGDLDAFRPILHEAHDEGRIAGHNAAGTTIESFVRRVPLGVTFSDPNLAFAGLRHEQLEAGSFVTGGATFENQGRAVIESHNAGCLRIYAETKSGRLLGTEMIAPAGEHLAHLLAWAIQKQMTVHEVLQMPFYHPTIEEGLRTALRDLAEKVDPAAAIPEMPLEPPIRTDL